MSADLRVLFVELAAPVSNMLELRNLLYFIASCPDDEITQRRRAEAASLARELFPVRAKALAWEMEGDDICSNWIDGRRYRIRSFPGASPSDDLPVNCALCVGESANSLQWLATIDEAKAWCESHHQARFLEQLACK